MGVVFVGGVHGVGKTTACTAAAAETGFVHTTASDLIRSERSDAIPNHGKAVPDVADNQRLLIRAAGRLRERETQRILIDGHFTIINTSGGLDAIPPEVFRAMNVTAAVVYQDDPASVAARRAARDDDRIGADTIAAHQNAELEQARRVSDSLGIPLVILEAFDSDGLADALRGWDMH